MIEFTSGDILKDEAEAIVNTVNCVGIMGRGIALQFKNAWPENFKAYQLACKRDEVQPGRMFMFEVGQITSPRWIVNFPTKRHWKGKSRMEDIDTGLEALAAEIRQRGIRSIAIPPLGSGLGGLDWAQVRPRIEALAAQLPGVRVRVYEPNGAPPAATMRHVREVPTMTTGRAALVGLMHRYMGGLLDPSISLLEVHKLMYFLQAAGEPLRLNYVKAPYGPYAENLRHVLRAVEGHLVVGYADGGDAPDKALALVPQAVGDANAFLREHAETQVRFDRVNQLVEGFETPFGLELLATVHWVVTTETHEVDHKKVSQHVYDWNERKRQFTSRQIGVALAVLTQQGWLSNEGGGAST